MGSDIFDDDEREQHSPGMSDQEEEEEEAQEGGPVKRSSLMLDLGEGAGTLHCTDAAQATQAHSDACGTGTQASRLLTSSMASAEVPGTRCNSDA